MQSRRTTRLTRTHLDENATAAARGTRGAAKPVAVATVPVKVSASAPVTRRTALAANKDKTEAASATRTVDAAKRKRDALGELTNKAKTKVTTKGKDGKPLVSKTNDAGRRTHSATNSISDSAKEEIMEVDLNSKATDGVDVKAGSEEAENRPRFSRRLSARTVSASASAPAHPSTSTLAQVAPRRVVSVATRSIRAPAPTRSASAQSIRADVPAPADAPVEDGRTRTKHQPTPEEDSDGPAHKRRRTSSIDAEEASRAVAQVTEKSFNIEVADGEEIWTDLDKDDDGDPLMVSEYVIDIFEYMMELEVSA